MTDSISGIAPLAASQTPANGVRQAIMSAAAGALGMSTSDVQSALRNGSSLADLAQQQGVSKDTVVSAVAKGLQSATSGSSAAVGDPTQIAQNIVDRKGAGGHHHHHNVQATTASTDPDSDSDSTDTSAFAKLSSLLGMSETNLLSSLESGSTLPSLLQQQGLTTQSLQSALGSSLNGSIAIDTTA